MIGELRLADQQGNFKSYAYGDDGDGEPLKSHPDFMKTVALAMHGLGACEAAVLPRAAAHRERHFRRADRVFAARAEDGQGAAPVQITTQPSNFCKAPAAAFTFGYGCPLHQDTSDLVEAIAVPGGQRPKVCLGVQRHFFLLACWKRSEIRPWRSW